MSSETKRPSFGGAGSQNAWQVLEGAGESRVACSKCSRSLGTRSFIARVFKVLSRAVSSGQKVVIPGIGTIEIRDVPARELDDRYFHSRTRSMKTLHLKPNRALIKKLNNLK